MKVIIDGRGSPALMHAAVRAASYHVTELVTCSDELISSGATLAADMGARHRPLDRRGATSYAQALVALWNGKTESTKKLIDDARRRMLLVYVYRIEDV